ncbi:hypothetical protein K402DRAFT_424709 [Aulographum hederae CBS 113979]|uniref:Uncharacterized protein n=1 Tax=Aulographum hederae CBS 113979 TaxID=1176131 RepID=A0A6G1GMT5_9PEZI|nr:hypothetical protein K402DRAFT_424709 [Aulographum hederae CBS 113979]
MSSIDPDKYQPESWDKAGISNDLIPAKEDDALIRVVYWPTDKLDAAAVDDVVYYQVAHRCATLIPYSKKGIWGAYTENIDDDNITARYAKVHPSRTFAPEDLDLDGGMVAGFNSITGGAVFNIAQGNDTQKNVQIHAEDLVIYRGTYIDLPSKKLTIFARRIIIADPPSEKAPLGEVPSEEATEHDMPKSVWDAGAINKVTFDCSGRDGVEPPNPPGDQPEGHPGGTYKSSVWADPKSYGPETGPEGTNGTQGDNAKDGGSVFICAQIVHQCTKATGTVGLSILCRGGDGGRGQGGGRGGKGGHGLDRELNHDHHDEFADLTNGGAGGKGGDAGVSGSGGSGGMVCVRSLPVAEADPEFPVTQPCFLPVAILAEVNPGANGPSGDPGHGGDGGDRGYASGYGNKGPEGPSGDVPTNSYVPPYGLTYVDDLEARRTITPPVMPKPNLEDEDDTAREEDAVRPPPIGYYALCLNPAFLTMLVQRLEFEYQVLFGSYFEVLSHGGKTLERLRFEESFAWLTCLYDFLKICSSEQFKDPPPPERFKSDTLNHELWTNFKPNWDSPHQTKTREIFFIAFDRLSSFGARKLPPSPATDTYGQSFQYIADTGFSLPELQKAVRNLLRAEQRRADLAAALARSHSEGTQAAEELKNFQKYINDIDSTRKTACEKVESTREEVDNLKKKDGEYQKVLEELTTELEILGAPGTWGTGFSCQTIMPIVSAIGACLMFTPAASGLVLAGNLLSVGSSASGVFSTVSAAGGLVDKNALQTEFHSIEAGLSDEAITERLGSLADPTSTTTSLKVVIMLRSRFETLVQRYYPGHASAHVRATFDRFVDAAQAVNNAILAHEQAKVAQAQVEAYYTQAMIGHDVLENDGDAVAGTKTQIYMQIYDETCVRHQALLIRWFFDAIRVISALKLKATSLSRSLIKLGSWNNMDARFFNDIVLPQLQEEARQLRRLDNADWKEATTFKGSITCKDYPDVFGYDEDHQKLREMEPFVFQIMPENCKLFGIDPESHYNVRMKHCRAVLVGARLKDESGPDLAISTEIIFTGRFQVLTGRTREVKSRNGSATVPLVLDFDIDRTRTGSRYKYDRKNPRNWTPDSEGESINPRMVDLGDGPPRPVQSPLARMLIWWNTQDVDTSKVTEVYLEFDAVYGSVDHKDPEPRNAALLMSVPSTVQYPLPPSEPLPLFARGRSAHEHHTIVTFGLHDRALAFWKGLRIPVRRPRVYSVNNRRGNQVAALTSLAVPHFQKRVPAPADWRLAMAATGSSPSEKVDNIIANPDSFAFVNGRKYLYEGINNTFNKLPPEDRFKTILSSGVSSDHHEGLVAARISLSDEQSSRIKYDKVTVLACLKSLPFGATGLTKRHTANIKALKTPKDVYWYLEKHDSEIKRDEAAALAAGGEDIDSFRLGEFAVVGLNDFRATKFGDVMILSCTAVTFSLHSVEGLVNWNIAHDPNKKEMMLFNWGMGRHKSSFLEMVNQVTQEPLFGRAFKDWPITHEALRTGQSVEALIEKLPEEEKAEMKLSRARWAYIDVMGLVGAIYRSWTGPNTAGDKINTRELGPYTDEDALLAMLKDTDFAQLAAETGPDVKRSHHPGGYYINENSVMLEGSAVPGYTQAIFADGLLALLEPAQSVLLETSCQSFFGAEFANKTTQTAFATAIRTLLDEHYDAEVAKLPADARAIPAKIKESIMNSLEFLIEAQTLTREHFVSKFQSQLIDDLRLSDPVLGSVTRTELLRITNEAIDAHVHIPLLRAGGIVDRYADTQITQKGLKQYTSAEVTALIAAAANEEAAASAVLKRAMEERDRVDPLREEEREELVKREREVERRRREFEEARRDKSGLEGLEGYRGEGEDGALKLRKAEEEEERRLEGLGRGGRN